MIPIYFLYIIYRKYFCYTSDKLNLINTIMVQSCDVARTYDFLEPCEVARICDVAELYDHDLLKHVGLEDLSDFVIITVQEQIRKFYESGGQALLEKELFCKECEMKAYGVSEEMIKHMLYSIRCKRMERRPFQENLMAHCGHEKEVIEYVLNTIREKMNERFGFDEKSCLYGIYSGEEFVEKTNIFKTVINCLISDIETKIADFPSGRKISDFKHLELEILECTELDKFYEVVLWKIGTKMLSYFNS